MTGSLYALMTANFPADRARLAIDAPGRGRWSYAQLEDEVARHGAAMAACGVHRGDRVAVCVEKSPEALFVYLACLRQGFVFVPMNTAYREAELDYLIGNADPALVICDPGRADEIGRIGVGHGVPCIRTLGPDGEGTLADAARQAEPALSPAPCTEADLAAILYTSGTTGRPKGAMLSHGNLASNGLVLRDAWAFTGDDVLLHALPVFHAHGLFVACHCALLAGAAMIWLPRFDRDEVIAHLARATAFMGVPTFYTRLLAENDFGRNAAAHMRLFTSGSAPLLAETFEAFRDRTDLAILERYGMTETGMNTSNPYDGERRGGTVGFPLPQVELRVVDEAGAPLPPDAIGDLQVRGPNVFGGYWRMPEKSAEEFTTDGWFKTGDIARIDTDGYVHLVGRARDLIICGGYNVYPKEVETAIDDMAGVGESAVIGVPHPDFGEAAVAVVTLTGGVGLDEAGTIAALKDRLANYKVPKRVFAVDALPRNAMGKVQKNLLREQFKDACR